jgi:hypothetical protein
MRVLVLVIYSENLPVYKEHLKAWRLYTKANPSFDVYFMTFSSEVKEKTLIDDILYIPGEESFRNLPLKFISALEFFPYRNYDFILRTNMSSFWVFHNLLPVLESLPTDSLFAGECHGDFISGSGMFFTPDVCDILVKRKERIVSFRIFDVGDDVRISAYLAIHHDIHPTQLYPRCNYIVWPENGTESSIPETIFHFRLKQGDEYRKEEYGIMENLYKRFYLHQSVNSQKELTHSE